MKVLGLWPNGKAALEPAARQAAGGAAAVPAPRRIVRQRIGYELVGGASETEDAANLLTCGLSDFEAHMRQVYPDWQEFIEWMEDRRIERLGAAKAANANAARGGRRTWVWGWPDGGGGDAAREDGGR